MIMSYKVGEKINKYEIREILEISALASIYQAVDEYGHKVVISEFDASNKEGEDFKAFWENFEKICQQLSSLEHRYTAKVIDYFNMEKSFYVIREFFEGRIIKDYMANVKKPISERQLKKWAREIIGDIKYLHKQDPPVLMGVITPEALLLSPMGKIRIIDLGVARFFSLQERKDKLMNTNPGYAAPEMILKDDDPEIRGDVYSLGAMLHYLLTGLDPNRNPLEFKDLKELRPDISEATRMSIMKALSIEPGDRFEDILEFRESLLQEVVKREKGKARLEASVSEIKIPMIPVGEIVEGSFTINNAAGNIMEGNIFADYDWMKIEPSFFKSNNEVVTYTISTAGMPPETIQENAISINTADDRIKIPVKISTAKGVMHISNPSLAVFLMYLAPIGIFFMLEFFRNYIIQNAINIMLGYYDFMAKGLDQLIRFKQELIVQMQFPTSVFTLGKTFAALFLVYPYLAALITGKIAEKLTGEIKRKTQAFSILAMIMPSILLVAVSLVHKYPIALFENAALRYVNLTELAAPFVLINIMTTVMMAFPRNERGHSMVDDNKFLKGMFYVIFVAYFIFVAYRYILC